MADLIPPDLARFIRVSNKKSYNFSSIDKQWIVTLTHDFIALTTTRYTRWEEFKGYFQRPFNALVSEYRPAPFSRVGLRYQNVIRRSRLGIDEINWSQLLKPYIAGILTVPELDDHLLEGARQIVEIKLSDNDGKVTLRHGLARDNDNKEICYLIDSDFYTENIGGSGNVLKRLDLFNRRARRLFRWCITDNLHQAMEPRPI
jgi:uncharacterized protein (TIGR04255 family)